MLIDPKTDKKNTIDLKIITTRVHESNDIQNGETDDIAFAKGSLIFPCGAGTSLEVSYNTDLDREMCIIQRLPMPTYIVASNFKSNLRNQLQVLEVQLPGKKVVNAAAFWNGLRGQKLKKL